MHNSLQRHTKIPFFLEFVCKGQMCFLFTGKVQVNQSNEFVSSNGSSRHALNYILACVVSYMPCNKSRKAHFWHTVPRWTPYCLLAKLCLRSRCKQQKWQDQRCGLVPGSGNCIEEQYLRWRACKQIHVPSHRLLESCHVVFSYI